MLHCISQVPLGTPVTKPVIRDPTSPLPQPPPPLTVALPPEPEVTSSTQPPRNKSVIETKALTNDNQSFTTSIYLNQGEGAISAPAPSASLIVNRKTSLPFHAPTKATVSIAKL